MSKQDDRFLPPPRAFTVRVVPNPKHPDGERYAEEAMEVIDAALTASGYPDHPPRRLRTVPDRRSG